MSILRNCSGVYIEAIIWTVFGTSTYIELSKKNCSGRFRV